MPYLTTSSSNSLNTQFLFNKANDAKNLSSYQISTGKQRQYAGEDPVSYGMGLIAQESVNKLDLVMQASILPSFFCKSVDTTLNRFSEQISTIEANLFQSLTLPTTQRLIIADGVLSALKQGVKLIRDADFNGISQFGNAKDANGKLTGDRVIKFLTNDNGETTDIKIDLFEANTYSQKIDIANGMVDVTETTQLSFADFLSVADGGNVVGYDGATVNTTRVFGMTTDAGIFDYLGLTAAVDIPTSADDIIKLVLSSDKGIKALLNIINTVQTGVAARIGSVGNYQKMIENTQDTVSTSTEIAEQLRTILQDSDMAEAVKQDAENTQKLTMLAQMQASEIKNAEKLNDIILRSL